MNDGLLLSVSDFVAVFNQTIEFAYPTVSIVGELSNFRVSKGKWVYFDLKDDTASLRFFGTIYNLPGPLEDGMQLQVRGVPRLHSNFGFSITIQHIQAVGEGSIKKAAALLQAKLEAEGLFDPARKRSIPYPPNRIGLVTSGESAAYADFVKIIGERWGGLNIVHADVQVQGEAAPAQIAAAIERLNAELQLDAIVITRGGGSADDLQAFSSEVVVRAVAGSRTPTLVAIGHEVDTSLAELAADVWASTPSNAAEQLVPDKVAVSNGLQADLKLCWQAILNRLARIKLKTGQDLSDIRQQVNKTIVAERSRLAVSEQLLHGYDPRRILKRGYIMLSTEKGLVSSVKQLQTGDQVRLRLVDGQAEATVTDLKGL